MPSLSRTQKYAELRASLTNDTETNSANSKLESYAQKLNDLENKSMPKKELNNEHRNELESLKERIDEILRPYTKEEKVLSTQEELINKAQEASILPQEIVKPTINTDNIFITLPNEDFTKIIFSDENKVSKEEMHITENPLVDENNEAKLDEKLPTIDEYFDVEEDKTEPKEEISVISIKDIDKELKTLNETENAILEDAKTISQEDNDKELDVELPTIDEYFDVNDIKVKEELEDIHNLVLDEVEDIATNINKTEETLEFDIAKESSLLNDESANVHLDSPLVFDEGETILSNPGIDSKEEDGVELPIDEKTEVINETKVENIQEELPKKEVRTLDDYINDKYISSENYINETIAEVNAYNRNEGERLIEDIPVSIIDEVRNHVVPENNDLKTEEIEDTSEESLEEIMEKASEPLKPEEIETKEAINDVILNIEEDSLTPNLYENTSEIRIKKEAEFLNEEAKDIEIDDDVLSFIPEKKYDFNPNKENTFVAPVISIDDDKKVEEIETDEDDEFSTTVSLQINKIMQELDSMNNKEEDSAIPEELIDLKRVEPVAIDASDYDKKNVPDFISAFFNDDLSNTSSNDVMDYYNHPVKAISQEEYNNIQTEVVEIKNISELNQQDITRTIEETKPFIVEEDADYVEDTTPNRLLNIILIALIIIFLAVFFVIVYYILKARGII